MFMRIAVIIVACYLLSGCNQTAKYYDGARKDTTTGTSPKADSSNARRQQTEIAVKENDLQLFCNNEISAYCVLLPLHEFKEDFGNQSVVKAQHKFLLRQDSSSFTSIELKGFSIDGKNMYNTKLFYERDKRNVEEGGLGIDTAYMDEKDHLYVIKGYLPNYHNMRFVQLNWILEDRIAVYFNYDEKDEILWMQRIAAIIKRGVKFDDR
jgi:predicted small secreted protein